MARRNKGRGRYWVAFWLGLFLLVAGVVIARQKAALDTAGQLRKLKERRGALEASQAELERRITVASTAEVLLPKVAKLGLTLPHDSMSTILVIGSEPAAERGSR
jgi:hypothetical protein